jgi:hypothetical protein
VKLKVWHLFPIIAFYVGLAVHQFLEIAALERGEVDAVTVWAPLVAVYGMAGKPGVAFVELLPAMAFAWVLYRVLWHREVFAPDRA